MKYVIKESQVDILKKMVDNNGLYYTSKLVGGIDNLVRILYDGDIKNFAKDNDVKLVFLTNDGMSLYIHELVMSKLNLPNDTYMFRNEITLGKFYYGAKNGLKYSFTAKGIPNVLSNRNNQKYYKVVGTSGDSGFGYSFITKKNTLGKRYREQIYRQIIDKFNLTEYM